MSLLKTLKNSFTELLPSRKNWTDRQFKFYLIFGELEDSQTPWIKKEWTETFEPLLKAIVQKSPEFEKTGIRVLEYKKNSSSDYYSVLKLGRLRWNTASHQKWTIENTESDEVKFNNFESWTPIWTECEKTDSAPDIYISIKNEDDSKLRFDKLQFNVFVVIAIAEDLKVDCNSIIVEFSKKINAKIAVCKKRSWSNETSLSNNSWSFHNWIQDTFSNGIYKGQSLHSFQFEEIEFEPFWQIIYK